MKHIWIIFFTLLTSASISGQYSQHESIGYASTAFGLQKGENRFTTNGIIINNYTRGLSDNLSVSIGGLIPGIAMARVKYTHKITDYLRVGISPMFDYEFDGEYSEFSANLAGILTIGNPKHFINISYSKNFNEDETWNFPHNISLGFSVRLSEHFRLLSENHIFSYYSPFPLSFDGVATNSLLLRWSFKKRHQVQLGAYLFSQCYTEYYDGIGYRHCDWDYPLPVLPTLSYSIYWGKG